MKSIMEKANTISKAVEKAWERAGSPQSFSIKVLETPEKNFFGMTTKSAKIALFYGAVTRKERPARPVPQRSKREPKKVLESPKRERRPERKERTEWSAPMIDAAQLWLKNVLSSLNKKEMTFDVIRKNAHLVFLFDRAFFTDSEQERFLFSSFALLMLKALRIKFGDQVKYLKVVLQQKNS